MQESLRVSRRNEPQASPRRILIVEDDPEMRSLLAKALVSRSHQICQAADGAEAIARLGDQDRFDVVISDVRMPQQDGHAVLNAVRDHSPGTKVILITAFGEVEEYLDTMDRGAYEYLNKPLRMSDLMQVVDRALAEQVVMKGSSGV